MLDRKQTDRLRLASQTGHVQRQSVEHSGARRGRQLGAAKLGRKQPKPNDRDVEGRPAKIAHLHRSRKQGAIIFLCHELSMFYNLITIITM